jgi:heavy metal sensor kinase
MMISIRARLTIWYVAVLALVVVGFSASLLLLQKRISRSQFDDELTTLASAVSTSMRAELARGTGIAAAARKTRQDVNVPNRTIAILDGDGQPVAARWRGFRADNVPPRAARLLTATVMQDAVPWRVRIQREETPDGPFVVLVAASEYPRIHEQHLLERMVLIVTPAALIFAAIVCWWAASRALRPVSEMSGQAERITLESLDLRLSGDDGNDEIGQLRRAFNRLLDRIAAGVATQRQFMADASHELRTPVSAARTAADVTLSQAHRDEDEYRDALAIVLAQTRRLGRLVDDMFVLARADAAGYPLLLRTCFIDEVLEECAGAARVLASATGVRLETSLQNHVVAQADGALVRQLAMNLLENAVKHTPEGGRVRLSLRAAGGCAEIAVSDTGGGIPPSERERIFERFVRLDAARSNTDGAGLGLPIARWIAESHQGTVTLDESGPSGSTFVARLPLTRPNPVSTPAAASRTRAMYARRVSSSKPIVASEAR